MVKTLLVDDLKSEGARLVRALRKQHFPLTAAFWFYLADEEVWRLIIVTPLADQEGPLRTYMKIMPVFDKLKPRLRFDINNVSVMSPKWQRFRDVQRSVEGMIRLGIDLQNTTFGDAHVYWWDGKPVERIVA